MRDQTPASTLGQSTPVAVCVVGLGKIGLPLAAQFASAGCVVTGVDIDEDVVRSVQAGQCGSLEEPGLGDLLRIAVTSKHLSATTDIVQGSSNADVVVIVVPLVVDVDGLPIFDQLDAVTNEVGRAIRPHTLVIYETTLPVGSTRGRFAARLSEDSGFTLGRDLFVCYSPERVYAGRIFADLRKYPKLVGGGR